MSWGKEGGLVNGLVDRWGLGKWTDEQMGTWGAEGWIEVGWIDSWIEGE